MLRILIFCVLKGIFFYSTLAQNDPEKFSLRAIQTEKGKTGNQIRKLSETEDVSCFHLSIRENIKMHKHEFHSEHVVVISGKAKMVLGEKEIIIRKGDLIFIPRNTPHSVILIRKELRVISIQAPLFDGKDRVMLE